jgi:hypothetical protein
MVQVYGDPLAISPASAFEPNFDKHWGDSRKIQQKMNLEIRVDTFFLFLAFLVLTLQYTAVLYDKIQLSGLAC